MEICEKLDFNPKEMTKVVGTRYDLMTFNMLIRLNENCNLDCEYCSMHSKTNKFVQPLETILEYIKETIRLNELRTDIETIGYYFYGGEPTVYDHFLELILEIHNLHINSKLHYVIETQTNLTKPISFFKKINKDINIKFIASYQNQAQNKLFGKYHINRYKETSKYLLENSYLNGFDIMLEDNDSPLYTNSTKPNVNEIKEMYQYLKSIINLLPINHTKFGIQMNTIDSIPVPEKYLDIFEDHKKVTEKLYIKLATNKVKVIAYNDFISNKEYNNFFGWKCDLISRQVLILFANPEVKVLGCMADMFSNKNSFCKDLEDYSKLLTKYYFEDKRFRCLYKSCTCELFIPKEKGHR